MVQCLLFLFFYLPCLYFTVFITSSFRSGLCNAISYSQNQMLYSIWSMISSVYNVLTCESSSDANEAKQNKTKRNSKTPETPKVNVTLPIAPFSNLPFDAHLPVDETHLVCITRRRDGASYIRWVLLTAVQGRSVDLVDRHHRPCLCRYPCDRSRLSERRQTGFDPAAWSCVFC